MTAAIPMTGAQIAWVEIQKDTEKAHEICETRARISNLVRDQVREKAFLRMPHYDIPEIKYSWPWTKDRVWTARGIEAAGVLTNKTRSRAFQITGLHLDLNVLRGKKNSHEYRD